MTARDSKKIIRWGITVVFAVLLLSGVIQDVLVSKSTEESVPSSLSSPAATVSASPVATTSATHYDRQRAEVVSVVDGDTVKVVIEGKRETIRIIGIDTPETVDPRKSVQCFGKEASDRAKSLLEGKIVYLEFDQSQGDRDVYKRLLRFVFLEDGSDVGLMLIREGYAHEYTYRSNPYFYQALYKAAEQEARENGRGLWNENACLVEVE